MLEARVKPGYIEVVEGKVEYGCIEPFVFWASGVKADWRVVRNGAGGVDVSKGVFGPEVGMYQLEWVEGDVGGGA